MCIEGAMIRTMTAVDGVVNRAVRDACCADNPKRAIDTAAESAPSPMALTPQEADIFEQIARLEAEIKRLVGVIAGLQAELAECQ